MEGEPPMSENDISPPESLQLPVKEAVMLLVSFAQAVNPQLGRHMTRVAKLARAVGEFLKLDPATLDQIEMAGMVHDIGLLSLPTEIQNKDVYLLTEKELLQYSEHPIIASTALEGVALLDGVGEMVLYHHEYVNGKGFPNGLSGNQIPMGSRIVLAVSDYCRIVDSWPRDMRRLTNHVRRHLGADEWKQFTFTDDPESIIEAAAEKMLLRDPEGKYDDKVVKAMIRVVHKRNNIAPADMVPLDDLQAGMVLMDDLRLEGGRLLITKGTRLADAAIQTLQSLGAREMIPMEIYVTVPEEGQ